MKIFLTMVLDRRVPVHDGLCGKEGVPWVRAGLEF